jgi:hypothetical protein
MQPVSQLFLLLAACGVLTASAAELVCWMCVLVRCLPLRLGPITVFVVLLLPRASVVVALVRGGMVL